MQTIQRKDATVYEFGPNQEPLLSVEPGERVLIETQDAGEGEMFEHGDGPFDINDVDALQPTPPGFPSNPVAGPIYIEGVDKGDTIAVKIEEIVPGGERNQGYTFTQNGGNLKDLKGWEECHETINYEVDLEAGPSGTTADGRGTIEVNGKEWTWDLNPHIGTIVTAPSRGVQETLTTQGPWGGNLDVREVASGSTVYLNSFNEGGLLYLGDVHASQGDSEYTGIAVETAAEVTIRIEVIKEQKTPGTFRVEDDEYVVQVDSAKNAGGPKEALQSCFLGVMQLLIDECGFSQREAYIHMSINPAVNVRVYQFIQPDFFTVGVKIPKSAFGLEKGIHGVRSS